MSAHFDSAALRAHPRHAALHTFFSGRTCFVTGGGGFVGQQTVVALQALGAAQIHVLDMAFGPAATALYGTWACLLVSIVLILSFLYSLFLCVGR